MTAIHTHPAPRASAHQTQHQAQHGAPQDHAVRHEHAWATESRHPTSAGHVLYVRCTACGIHRVDLQAYRDAPPAPLSRVVGGTSEVRAAS